MDLQEQSHFIVNSTIELKDHPDFVGTVALLPLCRLTTVLQVVEYTRIYSSAVSKLEIRVGKYH
jgi:hypothetical protein